MCLEFKFFFYHIFLPCNEAVTDGNLIFTQTLCKHISPLLCCGNSTNSQDSDEDSESDGADEPSKYHSADFQSSLRSFQMSESKRKRLRELEVSTSQLTSPTRPT